MGIAKMYFTTGEFAEICNVTKDTLFHYEKKGILIPEKVESNRYRYYESEQVNIMSIIATLRELGVAIDDIKEFMQDRNLNSFLDLCNQKEEDINQKIKTLKKMQKFIKVKKQNILENNAIEYFKVYIQEMRSESLYATKELKEHGYEEFKEEISKLIKSLDNLYEYSSIGGVRSKSYMYNKNGEGHYTYYYLMECPKRNKNSIMRSKGKYLVIYHKGSFDKLDKTYKILFDYIEENGIKVADEVYEDSLIDEFATQTESELVSKIFVRILEE